MKNLSFVFAAVAVLGLSSCKSKPVVEVPRSDALWNIISTQCLPLHKIGEEKNPCIEVNIAHGEEKGYVVFKDRVGDLQYLLMPTEKITGMESPEIRDAGATNYFDLAWKAKTYMDKKHGSVIPVEAVSLAINSQFGRSQNQLHIHVSCVKPQVQQQLQEQAAKLKNGWTLLPQPLLGHKYYVRKISEKELEKGNAFQMLADGVPGAKDHSGEFGLGLVAVKDKKKGHSLILLTSRFERGSNNYGSVEEIQDHSCPQLAH
ncbi:CDP-diacylglycerol diphosphatase [Bdellovibrio bacteriovorus]|uniref:CDP-diacylglycerol diphosphatase n=1 Tax=Bdellovibrio bacteriovorus TaxID=959 RepID=UPI003AA7AD74